MVLLHTLICNLMIENQATLLRLRLLLPKLNDAAGEHLSEELKGLFAAAVRAEMLKRKKEKKKKQSGTHQI